MLTDVVVDTNILVHASNPGIDRHQEARQFVNRLRSARTLLCVDSGFTLDQGTNASLIGQEYISHLRFGMLGYVVIAHLASSARIKQVPRVIEPSVGRRINQLVRKPRDRTFLRTARNSAEQVLASHDFRDFSVAKRKSIWKQLQIRVCVASQTEDLLK